jgi:leucyl-tRNA synthetase
MRLFRISKEACVESLKKLDLFETYTFRKALGVALNVSRSFLQKGICSGEQWLVEYVLENINLAKYKDNKFLKEFLVNVWKGKDVRVGGMEHVVSENLYTFLKFEKTNKDYGMWPGVRNGTGVGVGDKKMLKTIGGVGKKIVGYEVMMKVHN